MQISPFRCDAGRSRHSSVLRDAPSRATGARASRTTPVLEIQHVGVPRMLPLAAGGALAQEMLLPSPGGESRW